MRAMPVPLPRDPRRTAGVGRCLGGAWPATDGDPDRHPYRMADRWAARLQYTVPGDTVNTAARLEIWSSPELAGDPDHCRILASGTTFARIAGSGRNRGSVISRSGARPGRVPSVTTSASADTWPSAPRAAPPGLPAKLRDASPSGPPPQSGQMRACDPARSNAAEVSLDRDFGVTGLHQLFIRTN
jgi:hypothetical protein